MSKITKNHAQGFALSIVAIFFFCNVYVAISFLDNQARVSLAKQPTQTVNSPQNLTISPTISSIIYTKIKLP